MIVGETSTAVNGAAAPAARPPGPEFPRCFSREGKDPFAAFAWESHTAEITDDAGRVVFRQEGVEVPAHWSRRATDIVASKYLWGEHGTPDRETGARQLVGRVTRAVLRWGVPDGYLTSIRAGDAFHDELVTLCLGQYAAFNSPVWFNVGVRDEHSVRGSRNGWRWHWESMAAVRCEDALEYPQASACFILSVADDMESIMALAAAEATLFKYGSGAGSDLSPLRSSRERLTGGGRPSGPVSFMRIYDAGASVVKSGGRSRRAAKIQTLKCDHPDIMEFIRCKPKEDRKARALIAAGYSPGMTGDPDEAYSSVFFQNSNLSVRASDAFLEAAEARASWVTCEVTTGEPSVVYNAGDLLDEIAAGTWACGDPGLQYHDTINRWHTCPNTAPINSSNPCCFVGETLMDTSEGRIQMSELAAMSAQGQQLPLAFGFDKATGLPVLRPIEHVWISGRTTDLVEVVTDKGLVFRCTPDHVWLLRDGREVNAANLEPGDRLRKIGRSEIRDRGFRKFINHKVTPDCPNGSEYQARWMWEQVYGPIPQGMEVHHKDGDCTNDKLSNFELKPGAEHRSDHARGDAKGNYMEGVTDNQLVEIWESIEASPRRTHKGGPAVTPARWNAYIKANGLSGKVPLAGSPTNGGRIRGMSWAEFVRWIEDSRGIVNDSVKFVRDVHLNNPVPVYDASVPAVRNFAIGSDRSRHSVVVHNSEYMFLDDSACNLASLNLLKFLSEDGTFDVDRFRAAVRVLIVAQEILVDRASYPTAAICENSHRFRPLGLGCANLGGLLLSFGVPYDSDAGRSLAAAVTSLMTAEAYRTSAELAAVKGPFDGFAANREPMLRVIGMHRDACVEGRKAADIRGPEIRRIWQEAEGAWRLTVRDGLEHGYRNAQVTLNAPTGTIAFMMDCDTTGIEPELALVKHKSLSGGGRMRIANRLVGRALGSLGYPPGRIANILAHVERHGTVEGCPDLNPNNLPVFDCAFPVGTAGRSIHWRGHLRMLAAIQPHISGASSKTINMPGSATPADIREVYLEAWRLGVKCVAIFRDGSKGQQPLTAGPGTAPTASVAPEVPAPEPAPPPGPRRERLPDTRAGITHKGSVSGHEMYITVGMFPDGRPGELFVTLSKEGSTLGGLMDQWATMVSIGLQYGVPLGTIVRKFKHQRFEPSGVTAHPEIRIATSMTDYIARWLELTFRDGAPTPAASPGAPGRPEPDGPEPPLLLGPACDRCGGLCIRTGNCHTCSVCGTSQGCA